MTYYAIGTAGAAVSRYCTNPDVQALEPGQVMLAAGHELPSGQAISSDGLSLIAIDIDADAALAAGWAAVRGQRNGLLDCWRWTIALDSPLSAENQSEWLDYLRTLNRLTIDFATPDAVVWPEAPGLVYSG